MGSNNISAPTNLGIAPEPVGHFDEAANEHREAVRIYPGCPEAHFNPG
jgi:hypothetical protein